MWAPEALSRFGVFLLVLGAAVLGCGGSRGHGGRLAPMITGVDPDTGGTSGGDWVDVSTAHFVDDFTIPPTVFFGTDQATVVGVSPDKTITVVTPPHGIQEAVDVTVEGSGMTPPETARLPGGFTYRDFPTIVMISPSSGDVAGGTAVTIATTGFQDDFTATTPTVLFGADLATVSAAVDAKTVTVLSPPHPVAEAVAVEVRSTGILEVATVADGFTYTDIACPSIRLTCDVTGATPDNGPVAGGNQITVTGGLFCDANPRVIFGMGGPSVPATFITDQELTIIVPPAAAPGPVELFYGDDVGCFAVPIPFCCYTYN